MKLLDLINEHYNSDTLYPKDKILRLLEKAPKHLKELGKKLPDIECENDLGQKTICTRIPEVLYIYFTGGY
jgi:hypothetical protein